MKKHIIGLSGKEYVAPQSKAFGIKSQSVLCVSTTLNGLPNQNMDDDTTWLD